VSLLYDPERSYLHTYAREGALQTYTLKSGQFTPLFHISSLYRAIQPALPVSATGKRHTIDRVSFGVASMHAVPLSESRLICLVMVSFSGLRIYLSDTSSYGSGVMFNAAGTANLRVVHIRFPPGTDAQLPGEVLNADYLAGSFVCAYSDDPNQDTSPVFCATADVGRLVKAQESAQSPQQQQQGMYGGMSMGYGYAPRPPMHEWAVTPRIPGRPWAVDHLPLHTQTTATGTSLLHVLATQFVQPPEQFLVLTNQGLNFFVRKRPVDVLRVTLERGEGVGPAGGQSRGGVGAFAEAYVIFLLSGCASISLLTSTGKKVWKG
jgi:nuclear pore complex protein Nup155